METPVTSTKPPQTFAECTAVAVPMIDMLNRISGRWSLYVIMALMHGPMWHGDGARMLDDLAGYYDERLRREMAA